MATVDANNVWNVSNENATETENTGSAEAIDNTVNTSLDSSLQVLQQQLQPFNGSNKQQSFDVAGHNHSIDVVVDLEGTQQQLTITATNPLEFRND